MATATMAGRVCLITGGTSGIGKETALGLAQRGATVIVVSRNRERGDATVRDIQTRSGNGAVSALFADLSSMAEVRRLAETFIATGQPLHVLVNNAGAMHMRRTLTADGYEMTFALNHLAPFLLTNLLLPTLVQSGAPGRAARIVTLSSGAHMGGTLDFDDLQNARGYSGFGAYSESKLANLLFTYELARLLANAPAVANAVHPGFVASGFGFNNGWAMRTLLSLTRAFQKTAAQGAETSIYVASAGEIEGISGTYFVDCKPTRSSKKSYDRADARQLWQISAEMTGVPADVTLAPQGVEGAIA